MKPEKEIIVGGQAIALSRKVGGLFQYQRFYPGGAAYANLTGYYSLIYGATDIEQSENDILSGDSDKLFVRRLSDYRLQVHVILLVRRALLHSAPSSWCRLPALRAAALLSPSSCRSYARSGACADLL